MRKTLGIMLACWVILSFLVAIAATVGVAIGVGMLIVWGVLWHRRQAAVPPAPSAPVNQWTNPSWPPPAAPWPMQDQRWPAPPLPAPPLPAPPLPVAPQPAQPPVLWSGGFAPPIPSLGGSTPPTDVTTISAPKGVHTKPDTPVLPAAIRRHGPYEGPRPQPSSDPSLN